MFENLNWWEIGALLLVALLIFGDRLPNVISDGLRMLRNLRDMARNATGDLSRELGTDIQLEDLHPKAFIRKHLLSEEDEEAIRKPLQGTYDKIRSDLTDVQREFGEVASAADIRASAASTGAAGSTAAGVSGSAGAGGSAAGSAPPVGAQPRAFDADAT
ncbi:preprotein translocase subunit TatB [Plantactinospora sp. CA-290183]|uniref:preprotein translocase subunit TatB n=1 Tax=Plantactinospora sp. CA-290183 TaxID=3240006 RepID=UPI003D8A4C7D